MPTTQEEADHEREMAIKGIQYGGYFRALNRAQDFANLIDDLTGKLIQEQKRRADLLVAEDRALFGDGDHQSVLADLNACDAEIDRIQKLIEGAQRRGAEAGAAEAFQNAEELGEVAKAKAAELRDTYKTIFSLIEQIRQQLFIADRQTNSLVGVNQQLQAAGRGELAISHTLPMHEGLSGTPAPKPMDRMLRRTTISADAIFLAMLKGGGPLGREYRIERKGPGSHRPYAVPAEE